MTTPPVVPDVKTSSLGYIATVAAACVAVGYLVQRWGASLPLPTFVTEWFTDDQGEDEEYDEDGDDE